MANQSTFVWGHRQLVAVLVTAFMLGFLATLFTSFFQFTRNLGPHPFVVFGNKYDIHRHDFIAEFGWPLATIEHHMADWYLYSNDTRQMRLPNQADLERWVARRAAELELSGQQTELSRLKSDPYGNKWIIRWSAIVGDLLIWSAICITIPLITVQSKIWRQRTRMRQGRCLACGYDLRASRGFGRCPECGSEFEKTGEN